MVEGRKQAVSIRMNATDVRKVKKLASRLGVRDSDVIRFAVKNMLARLGHDVQVNFHSPFYMATVLSLSFSST